MDAYWSGAPIDGPVLGVTYTDTNISAGTTMSSNRGTRASTAGFWFSQFTYRYDDLATKPTPLGESFVVDFGTDLVVTVDKGLGRAAASGTVMAVTCTIDASFTETCGDPAAVTISGTWNATGARLQTVSTYHAKGPGMTMNQTFQGSDRQAVAAVTIGGVPVAGVIGFSDIYDSHSNFVTVCHAPAC
jgi:hypothetical protein